MESINETSRDMQESTAIAALAALAQTMRLRIVTDYSMSCPVTKARRARSPSACRLKLPASQTWAVNQPWTCAGTAERRQRSAFPQTNPANILLGLLCFFRGAGCHGYAVEVVGQANESGGQRVVSTATARLPPWRSLHICVRLVVPRLDNALESRDVVSGLTRVLSTV